MLVDQAGTAYSDWLVLIDLYNWSKSHLGTPVCLVALESNVLYYLFL